MQPDKEIVIPLGYKGKVVITRPPTEYKVYTTVAELMHDFPRFVRVDKPFLGRFTTSVSVYSVSSGNGTNRLLIELFITTDSFSYFAIRPCVGKYLSSSSVFPVF
jgi:hypothetical protein